MDVAELHDRLAQRAFLHDDPDAYLAGVRDTLHVVADDDVRKPEETQELQELRGA